MGVTRMIPLSPRLLCCASMIQGGCVLDIGTDHAYLPAYLLKGGKVNRVIATDVRSGPLESAKSTLKKYGLLADATLALSDGFDSVDTRGVTDVVIAGMGGETICNILAAKSAGFLKGGVNLVLQPMTKAEVLRQWLAENGFALRKETAVKDTHIYTVMQAAYTGEAQSLSPADIWCGKLHRGERMTTIYIAETVKRLATKADGLTAAGQDDDAEAVRDTIRAINKWLHPEEETP